MYFYRIENSSGQGPYWEVELNGRYRVWQEGSHEKKDGRPGIFDEYPLPNLLDKIEQKGVRFEQCSFGFSNLKQLQAWFRPSELRKLEKMGYFSRRVKGEVIVCSPSQVMFLRK